jgi:multisubunit Na+/H+ antiporter MnhB subunit
MDYNSENMVFASLLNATAATIRSYLAVGVDTAKRTFDLPSFCSTFDFFVGGTLTTANLLNFPLKPIISPSTKTVFFDTGNAQCHEDNETGRYTRKKG